jgi:hypothetical protein
VQQLLAVERELAPRGVERGHQQRGRRRRAHEPHARATAASSSRAGRRDVQHRALRQRADDLVRAGQHRVGALRSALGGSARWKPKCGPHAWSTTSGTPAAWATSAQPATSAAMP